LWLPVKIQPAQITNHPIILVDEVTRPTHIEVNLRRLSENYHLIKHKVAPTKIMVIVKANAYEHGMVEVAKLLESLQVDYLGVAVLEVGILLRDIGIKTPILVLGGILSNQIPLFMKHDLALTAF
jgi:alanine racemase